MRRYLLFYRRGAGRWGSLTPVVHRGFYDRPCVNAAATFLRDNVEAEGVVVRTGDECFNVMVTLEPKATNCFSFEVPLC